MAKTPQVHIVIGSPLGASYDKETETVSITMVLPDGDHLAIEIDRPGFENLCRHIEHVRAQLPSPFARQ